MPHYRLIFLVFLSILGGCGSDRGGPSTDSRPPPSTSAQSATVSSAPPAVSSAPRRAIPTDRLASLPEGDTPLTEITAERWLPGGEGARVQVLAAGEAPRRSLRYEARRGASATLMLEVRSSSRVGGGDETVEPAWLGRVRLEVVKVELAAIQFEVETLGLTAASPDEQAALLEAGAPLLEHKTSWTVHPRGATEPPSPPSGTPVNAIQLWSSIAQGLLDAFPLVPAVPVGADARWRVLDRVSQGGIRMLRLSTFTLQRQADAGLLATAEVRQVPLRRGYAAGFSLVVESGEASGVRQCARQDALWPVAGASETRVDGVVEVQPGPGFEPTKNQIHLTQKLTLVRDGDKP